MSVRSVERTLWLLAPLFALWLSSALPLGAAESPALPSPTREETWQVLYLAGQRVGHAHVVVAPVQVESQALVRTSVTSSLSIRRFGQTLNMQTMSVTDETETGDLVTFEFEMRNPPASATKTTGTIDGSRLRLVSEVDGRISRSATAWKAAKSPTYQDRLLRVRPLKPGTQQEFEAYFPEMGKAGSLKVLAGERESVELLDGKTAMLQRLNVSNTLLPGVDTTVWVDDQGVAVKSSTAMLGTNLVTYTVPQEVAIQSLTVAELDLGVSTLVKTKPIFNPYSTTSAVYRVTVAGGNPAELLPSGDSQQVRKLEDHIAEVSVTALKLPETGRIEPCDEKYTKSSQFLPTDDARVREHAAAAAGPLTDPAAIAEAMEIYVHKKLTKKNFSTALASAGEVARNLEGDCTEHAVLLTAMLRAKGIPARVVVGLIYVSGPSAFGGHMWTEAFLNGKWVPLDATLGRGGIGATHIKLGDSAFADEDGTPSGMFTSLINVIGKLKIEVVNVK